jgi:hypothetical protein
VIGELAPASAECLRWRPGGRHSWRHLHEGGFDADRYGVTPLSETAARGFVLHWHYAGTWPSARQRYGLWEELPDGAGMRLVGAAVLSVPTNKRVLTNVFPNLVPYYESIELGRFVLIDEVPGNGDSAQ